MLSDREATLAAQAPVPMARRHRRDGLDEGRGEHAGALRLVPVLVTALTLVLGLLGGTAYAYFSATGSGSGKTAVGKLAPVTVEQATVTPGSLFPGGKAGLSLKIDNPNAYALTLVGVSEVGTTASVTPATAGCAGSNVSVSPTVASGLTGYTLNANSTTTGVTSLVVPTGAVMSTTAPNACQTKAFHIDVAVEVQS